MGQENVRWMVHSTKCKHWVWGTTLKREHQNEDRCFPPDKLSCPTTCVEQTWRLIKLWVVFCQKYFTKPRKTDECIWGRNYNNRQWNFRLGIKRREQDGWPGSGKQWLFPQILELHCFYVFGRIQLHFSYK